MNNPPAAPPKAFNGFTDMTGNLRIWTIRITAAAIAAAALLILTVLYPVLTYAGKTHNRHFAGYYQQPSDGNPFAKPVNATALRKLPPASLYNASGCFQQRRIVTADRS